MCVLCALSLYAVYARVVGVRVYVVCACCYPASSSTWRSPSRNALMIIVVRMFCGVLWGYTSCKSWSLIRSPRRMNFRRSGRTSITAWLL